MPVFCAEPVGEGSTAFIRFSTANFTTGQELLNYTDVTEMEALLELAQVVSEPDLKITCSLLDFKDAYYYYRHRLFSAISGIQSVLALED